MTQGLLCLAASMQALPPSPQVRTTLSAARHTCLPACSKMRVCTMCMERLAQGYSISQAVRCACVCSGRGRVACSQPHTPHPGLVIVLTHNGQASQDHCPVHAQPHLRPGLGMEPKRPNGAPRMRSNSHSDGLRGIRPVSISVDASLQQEASPAEVGSLWQLTPQRLANAR